MTNNTLYIVVYNWRHTKNVTQLKPAPRYTRFAVPFSKKDKRSVKWHNTYVKSESKEVSSSQTSFVDFTVIWKKNPSPLFTSRRVLSWNFLPALRQYFNQTDFLPLKAGSVSLLSYSARRARSRRTVGIPAGGFHGDLIASGSVRFDRRTWHTSSPRGETRKRRGQRCPWTCFHTSMLDRILRVRRPRCEN